MSVIEKLSSSLNRMDQVPNQELAKLICINKDTEAVKELVILLNGKSKRLQGDAIKTLYEIGEQNPALISPYINEFIALLDSKNNRLQWGTMTAIDRITPFHAKTVYDSLSKILQISDEGSVITKDHAINILIHLCDVKEYATDAFVLLLDQLKVAFPNQLPKYAEQAIPFITKENKAQFLNILSARLADVETETKRVRIEKVIQKIDKKIK